MYSTCLFCYSDLGANEVIEHLPVGRRLAFDPAKGRLWVVCRKCERWNLTPIEERWEALEECERAFRDTKLRASTPNIALTRLREGLELVRIGQPLRPELAAWRYGDQFGRRRRKHMLWVGGGVATFGGLLVAGAAAGVFTGVALAYIPNSFNLLNLVRGRNVQSRIHVPGEDAMVELRLRQLYDVSITAQAGGWALHVPYTLPASSSRRLGNGRLFRPGRIGSSEQPVRTALLTGDDALRAAAQLLPAINASGAGAKTVTAAVDLLEGSESPASLFQRYTQLPSAPGSSAPRTNARSPGAQLARLPAAARLALEMISHEDAERRAMEGELAELEAAWRSAEEIAGISDDMFLPDDAQRTLDRLKNQP